jgi:hypothetical protein
VGGGRSTWHNSESGELVSVNGASSTAAGHLFRGWIHVGGWVVVMKEEEGELAQWPVWACGDAASRVFSGGSDMPRELLGNFCFFQGMTEGTLRVDVHPPCTTQRTSTRANKKARENLKVAEFRRSFVPTSKDTISDGWALFELELELIQAHVTQKPVLRVEVGKGRLCGLLSLSR